MADQDKVRPDIRIKAIATAIPALDPEADFTTAGKPEVRALEGILGFDITAPERDAAFEASQDAAAANGKKAVEPRPVVTIEDVLSASPEEKKD